MFKQRIDLPLEKKIYAIRQSEQGQSSRRLAKELGVCKTQILNILKRKDAWLDLYERSIHAGGGAGGAQPIFRAFRKTRNEEINQLMHEWYRSAKCNNWPTTGPIIQAKALAYAEELGIKSFYASNGWMQAFRKRHRRHFEFASTGSKTTTATSTTGTSSSTTTGTTTPTTTSSSSSKPAVPEFNSQPQVANKQHHENSYVIHQWQNQMSMLCQKYRPGDIWHLYEIGFYYRALPDNTASLVLDNCTEGERSGERLTLALCCSLTGEKMKPILIGQQTDCFQNLTLADLPVTWCCDAASWMTSDIFRCWVVALDTQMKRQQRKILLVLATAACHPDPGLSNVKCLFVPNVDSKVQPLKQEVVTLVKAEYRRILLRHAINTNAISDGLTGSRVTSLEAVFWIGKVWNQIQADVIRMAFTESGFHSTPTSIPDSSFLDITPKETEETMHLLRQFQELNPEEHREGERIADWNDYISFDDALSTNSDLKDEAASLLSRPDNDEAKNQNIPADPLRRDVNKLLAGLDGYRSYALDSGDTKMMGLLMDLQSHLCKTSCEMKTRQTLISDFLTTVPEALESPVEQVTSAYTP